MGFGWVELKEGLACTDPKTWDEGWGILSEELLLLRVGI